MAIVLTVLLFTASDYHVGIFWPLYWLSFYLRLLITTLVSLGHCIDCSSIYGFWWRRWYLLAIVLTVLLFTASDDHVGIFWPLYWLSFYLQLLITTLVSFGHCSDCSSIYGFWWPRWYLLAIVLTVLLFTASDDHVGIFWPLYWLSFYLRLLITTLVYFGHCIICPSIYDFWLPRWYLLAIVLTVLLFTASDNDVGIFWPLYWLSFSLRLLMTTLVSFGHCIDCPSIYGFWWPRWYLLAIVLTVLLFTASDDHVGIFWPLHWLSYLRLLITTLVSFGHCIDCPSIYGFWLPRWYILAIVLTVLLFTASDDHVGIFWPLHWLSFYLRLLMTTLVYFGNCIDCPSIYGFWLPRWYLLAIVLTVLLFTASDNHVAISWPLHWLFLYLRLLMTTFVSFGHCIDCPSIYGFWWPGWYLLAIVLTVFLFTASDDHVGIFWPLHWLFLYLRFWWPPWYILAIVLTVLPFTASDDHVGIFWPLYWLSFYLRLLITTLVSLGHCIDCSSIYGFWWRRWYLLAIVLTVLLFTASDDDVGIFWPLYWLSFYLQLLITTLVSFGHCIDCSSIYGFWWPRWYLLAIVLTVLLFTASDDHVGIFWPLYWLSYLRLLITTLVYFGHCIICPSIYDFWLPRWYLLAIVLTVLLFTASDNDVGIFWSLYWLYFYLQLLMITLVSFGHCIDCPSIYASDDHVGIIWPLYWLSFYLRLLMTTLVSFGHCIDCPSIYGFWWPRWYLLAIALTVLFTASDYHVGIFWPLYWLSFYLRLLITTLVSLGHCIDCSSIYGFWWRRSYLLAIVLIVSLFTLLMTTLVYFGHCIDCPSIYGFWWPRWYPLAIVLTVLLFTASDYHVGIFWPLYWLSFYLRLLITTLVSLGHCIDCSSIYGFWWRRSYLLAIVLTVLLFTASDYHVGIFWPLYWLSFYLRLLMTTLVSFGHCIDCFSIYASDDHLGIFWPLYWLSFHLRLLMTTLVSFGHCIDCPSIYGFWWPRWYLLAILLTVLLFTASDYHVGISWPLHWLFLYLRLLMTTLVSFGHCIDCPSIYGFWWPRWYLLAIVLTVLLFTASDYHVGIFWPLHWLFLYLRLLMTTLVSFGHCIDCPSIYASDDHVGIFWPLYWLSYLRLLITTLVYFGHCIICPSIYDFWLPRWYLLAIVLTVLFTASDNDVGIFWSLYWLSFYLRLLMITLVSFGHGIDCPSIYGFWWPRWYHLAIVLTVLLFTASDDHVGIFWPLYWLSFYLRLLITTLLSLGHCIDCSSIYGFWWRRSYLLAIVLTVLLFTASDDHVGIFWPLYWLSFYLRLLMTTLVSFGHCIDCFSIYASDDHLGIFWPLYWLSFHLRLLMTTLVSFGHCIDCPSIYGFWWPRWYLLAIVLTVLLFTASDDHVGIFWPLYWLSFYLRLLMTTLVSFGHCIDCPIYGFWLPRWYLLAIVLTVLLFTASDYHVGIFWPLYWLFFYLPLLMTTLVSFGHCIDCPSIYGFSWPRWYILAIVLTVLLFTASDYHVDIFWPLYWLSFYLRLLITTLLSLGHCIDCSSIYGFWWRRSYLLAIVLTVLLFTASDDQVGIFWPLYWLSFYLRLLMTTLVSFGHCIDCFSIYASDDHLGIFWPLYWLSFHLRLLMTTLVSFGHCIDCPSIYGFWLPRWYLLAIALTVPLFTASDDDVGIFWPLYWLSFYLRLLMTTLVSFGHCIDCPSIYSFWLPRWYLLAIALTVPLFTASDDHVGIFWPLYWLSFYLRPLMTTLVSFGHCIDCPIYGFWLPRWYILAIVLSVLLFTTSDYHVGIFWPLYWLSFYLRLLITTLVSFGHCIDCTSIYSFWWSRWYLLAIVLTVLLFTLLMTTLVSFGHCIDCPSIYGFWWPRWYLLAIVLTVLLFTASDDHVGIFWPLHWLSYLRLLITTLVSFGHCIDCPSIYGFWLPRWYLLAIALTVPLFTASDDDVRIFWPLYWLFLYLRFWWPPWYILAIVLTVLPFTASDDHVGILWPLYWLSFYLRLLITTLVSFGHCIDCPSIYGFWLPRWYLLAIALTVPLFTASDDDVRIFWPLYWLSFYLQLLITTLVSFGHCIDCLSIYGFWWPRWYLLAIALTVSLFTLLMTTLVYFGHCIDCPSIYGFWWPRWYPLAIVLTVLLFTVSDDHVGIFWPFYWLSFYLRLLITTLVSLGHCIDCSSIYGFWWPRWYRLAIVLTVLLFTASDDHVGIFWPLYWLSFYLQLLITTLVSFGHCIDCSSIYGFWWPRWYLLAIVLTVLLFTLLMTTLVSFGHCIDCPIYGFWLPRWYILAIVLSVLLFTTSDYHVGIFWPLYWLSYLRLLITTLVSFGDCIDCPSIYGFWWSRWYLLAMVLTVLLFTASDDHVGIIWPLYWLSFYLRLLMTTLVSFGHCIDCPSIYGFWLPRCYLLAIALTVPLFTASDDDVRIFWPLYWLSFYLRLLMTTLVSFGHCIDCLSIYGFWWPRWYLLAIALIVSLFTLLMTTLVYFGHCIDCPSIYGFWWPRWYPLAIVLTVLLFTVSDDHVGIFWPLYWLSFYLRLLMTTLVSFGHCIDCSSIYGFWWPRWYLLAIVLTVLLFTASDYHFGIFWPLYWLSFYLQLLITTLVSFGHCIDCPSIYGFWWRRWYLLAIVLTVLLFTASDYHLGIFWPLYWLSFYLRLLMTTLVSFSHCIDCPSIYGFWLPRWYLLAIALTLPLFTASDDDVGIFWPLYWLSFYLRLLMTTLVSFGHCIDCPSIYSFWWPRWYLLAIALTVLLFTASDDHVGIFWPLYWLSFYLRLLMTTLVSFGHCIDCPSIYGFWWPRWYHLAIVLTVLLFTASDYHVDISWPLHWLFLYLRLLMTTFVSFGHCIDCPSIYGFWWPRWYLLAIVLTVFLFTASDDHVGIFWPLHWLFLYLRFWWPPWYILAIVLTVLPFTASDDHVGILFFHCIDCPSIYGFWWPRWYLLAIVLTVLLFTASDDHVGIFWPLHWLFFYLRLLMTTLVSFGHCIDCPSIYSFWLPRWYLLAIVLTVLLFTASDYHVGIFWPLYWLSFYLRLLMTTLVSFGHCIDCPSIYGFWLPPWYLLAIVLTVLLFTASDDDVGIF